MIYEGLRSGSKNLENIFESIIIHLKQYFPRKVCMSFHTFLGKYFSKKSWNQKISLHKLMTSKQALLCMHQNMCVLAHLGNANTAGTF